MDRIAKVLPTALPDSPARAMPGTGATASNVEPIRQAALRRFWARMAAIYGTRWNSGFGDSPEDADGTLTVAGDTWRRGLVGISESQVGTGIAACIASTDPWPPTLPQFRAQCLGIPPYAEVASTIGHSAAARTPFVRLVWQHVDGWAFARSDQIGADRMLRGAYELARDHVMRGGAMPEVASAIEHKPEPLKPANPEHAAAVIAGVSAIFGRPELAPVPREPDPDLRAIEDELRAHYGTAEQLQAEVDQ